MSRGIVLVIDDSEITLKLTQRLLENAGYEVVTASSPLGVSSMILRNQPDLVLADVDMPALTGDQLVTLIKGNERLKQTRVVLHSDKPLDELQQLRVASGADGVIKKTDDLDAFLEAVQKNMSASE